MKSLPSSGWGEIERWKRGLVIELVKQKGAFWEAVADLRRRWNVPAQGRIPPDLVHIGNLHFPPDAPELVLDPKEKGWEERTNFSSGWRWEIVGLYNEFIPESARLSHPDQSRQWWCPFVSACVVYDPPEDKLEEYAESHQHIFLGAHDPEDPYRDDYPHLAMSRPPIVATRREEGIEWAYTAYADNLAVRVAERVAEQVRDAPDADTLNVIREALWEASREEDLYEPIEDDRKRNPTRAYIEVRPWHTERDVISAFRMIAATQERPGRGSDPKRPLRAVQCAVLHDRLGWKYKEIEAAYGWGGDQTKANPNTVYKHIKDGRRRLSE